MINRRSLGTERDKTPQQTREMWTAYYASLLKNSEGNNPAVNREIVNYAFRHTWRNSVRVVLERGGIRSGQRVLDAGCGWGRILMGLLDACVGIEFTAMDFIEESVLQGEKLFGTNKNGNAIEWKQGDLEAMPFADAQFDVVYSSRVFQHLLNPVQGVREIRRVLKRGGRFVVCHQNKWCPLNVRYYSRLYSPREVVKWYSAAGFEEFHVQSMDFMPGANVLSPKLLMKGERFWEAVPGINLFGGKVVAWGVK